MGIGDWANPQSPIPNPQSPTKERLSYELNYVLYILILLLNNGNYFHYIIIIQFRIPILNKFLLFY